MKVCTAISYFNDVKSLQRLVESLPKDMPIVAVDGRYVGFDWPNDESTDLSNDYLDSVPNVVVNDLFIGEQIDKRNHYLKLAAELKYDWVIIMDSDDFIYPDPMWQDWPLFYKLLEKYRTLPDYVFAMYCWISPLWFKNHNAVIDNTWQQYLRIIKNPSEVKYTLTHWQLAHKDNPDELLLCKVSIDGVRFTSDSVLRNKEFVDAGYKWAEWNLKEENKRSAKYNLDRMSKLLKGNKILMPDGTFRTVDNVTLES